MYKRMRVEICVIESSTAIFLRNRNHMCDSVTLSPIARNVHLNPYILAIIDFEYHEWFLLWCIHMRWAQ